MSPKQAYRGIFTIPSTPFREDGEIDVPSFRRLVDFCIECGAHGLVFPVNASEFTTLSDTERFELSEVLVDQTAGRLPVVIGVAGVSQEAAAKFARHAHDIGADSVIAMPPYIRRSRLGESLIFDYYKRLSDEAQMPVFIQNYVPPIGTDMSPEFLLKLCREIEHIQYIKEETVPSTIRLSSILEGNDGSCKGVFGGAGGRYLIEEYRRGVCGNMPGCHVTDVVVAFWNALEAGDEEHATYIYKEMAPLFFFERQLRGCYKEVLYRRGVIDCPLKRNGAMLLDDVASKYLDDILDALTPLMTWKK
ncbi:MAG: dihydrodipicolinate synthase family protein [Candidatus Bathyarchaeota archaeon]|nr:dihydrodipicolinate synthase family protein [Candidatus Bathyarchaeota archaeon]